MISLKAVPRLERGKLCQPQQLLISHRLDQRPSPPCTLGFTQTYFTPLHIQSHECKKSHSLTQLLALSGIRSRSGYDSWPGSNSHPRGETLGCHTTKLFPAKRRTTNDLHLRDIKSSPDLPRSCQVEAKMSAKLACGRISNLAARRKVLGMARCAAEELGCESDLEMGTRVCSSFRCKKYDCHWDESFRSQDDGGVHRG